MHKSPIRILKKHQLKGLLLVDVLMLGLIFINLTWIFFDALFDSKSFQSIIRWLSEDFYLFYEVIHQDFLKYDLIFISIYLSEFLFRWIIERPDHPDKKWYMFPIYRWYDLLGCIPVGSFHLLRILRVIVIIKKLHELEIINWHQTPLFVIYKKYMGILTEEVSDRVVVQVLNGMAKELQYGNPLLQEIVDKALLPKKVLLSDLISETMTEMIHKAYDLRRTEIHQSIQSIVHEAANRSANLAPLKSIPLFGDHASHLLESTVSDMIYGVTDQIVDYLRGDLSTEVIDETMDILFNGLAHPNSAASHLVQEVLLDIIEVVKAKVLIQQWKQESIPNETNRLATNTQTTNKGSTNA